jgi:hypothetical protein
MQWNTDFLDTLIAPEISRFTKAEIPDISGDFPEAKFWLGNHFLNNALRSQFKDRARQVVLGYLRRAHHAFDAFHEARHATLRFLDGNQADNPRIQAYYDAIALWETFSLQAQMAFDHFKWLNGKGAFTKNDGSVAFRLYTIANQVKHLTGCVDSGQCGQNDSLPLWLTNNGIHSFGTSVTFAEAAEQLRLISELANKLQDPIKFSEDHKAGAT